jgi:hypothetical protein
MSNRKSKRDTEISTSVAYLPEKGDSGEMMLGVCVAR